MNNHVIVSAMCYGSTHDVARMLSVFVNQVRSKAYMSTMRQFLIRFLVPVLLLCIGSVSSQGDSAESPSVYVPPELLTGCADTIICCEQRHKEWLIRAPANHYIDSIDAMRYEFSHTGDETAKFECVLIGKKVVLRAGPYLMSCRKDEAKLYSLDFYGIKMWNHGQPGVKDKARCVLVSEMAAKIHTKVWQSKEPVQTRCIDRPGERASRSR